VRAAHHENGQDLDIKPAGSGIIGNGMSVAPLFVPALASLDGLLPRGGVLDPEELEEVARGIAVRPEIWEPLVHADTERRRYELVYEDERMDAWVLSWMPGQGTGFHDHYISSVGVCVARGRIREDQMRYGMPAIERELSPGDSRRGNPAYIHRVQHWDGAPAVTIHVYSPRLDWVGQYRIDDDGVIRREVQPGRNELKDQLVSEGALHGVLERF
jgi:hypothetical protein